ncbi:murein DD-endopeptidase MepM/ murein hydrolase activator NlpD [Microbacterium resistens]|uniref:Murein DD-endopeptidase MepM/ murein hydrolase activator NlpD n=2 Tax=Microbacterium resistens TaxID=156977 RepID=A0ABU1SEZ7_9MICO|nr:murein DD-endopeptidase MepM/ murein hydrolase activator NlpD [Microbacterium resistens]
MAATVEGAPASAPAVAVPPVEAPAKGTPARMPVGTVSAIPASASAAVDGPSVGLDAALAALRHIAETAPAATSPSSATSRAARPMEQTAREVAAAPRRAKGGSFRRVARIGVPAGVMGMVGLLAISMTLPSQAIASGHGLSPATSLVASGSAKSAADAEAKEDIQAFIAPSDVQGASLQGAEGFGAVSQVQVAAESGIRFSDSLYTNDSTAKIQWPFIVGVAMSSPFGVRDGVMHEGIDLAPGDGAPIQSIADGTVRLASESDGGYGVGVYIDHIIDGQLVTSHYGHMQYGSLKVKTGDVVKVGDIVGLTGDTGHSFGPHLHFEIIVDGAKIDPLPWMLAHAGRH